MLNKQKLCLICKIGELKPGITVATFTRDNTVLVIRNVPALICDNCGEESFESDVNGRLLEIAEETIQAGLEVGIRSFAA